MVKEGFLFGQKDQRPEINKINKKWVVSFMMPQGSNPGDTVYNTSKK